MADIKNVDPVINKNNISRRDFLKLATAGSLAMVFSEQGRVLAEAREQIDNELKVDVVPWEGNAYHPHPINFTNRIDFLEDGPKPKEKLGPVQLASYSVQSEKTVVSKYLNPKKDSLEVDPVFIEPENALVKDLESEGRQFKGAVIDATSPLALAMVGAGFISLGSKNDKKSVTLSGGLMLTTGTFKILCDALTKPINPQDKSYYERFAGEIGFYYPLHPQLSSIRSVLIMDDVWNNIVPEYKTDSILAFSESHLDGLENFSKKSPTLLKDMLLYDNKFDSTLIKTARALGSLDVIFNYKLTNQSDGTEHVYGFSDQKFISALKNKLGNRLPPKPIPGRMEA